MRSQTKEVFSLFCLWGTRTGSPVFLYKQRLAQTSQVKSRIDSFFFFPPRHGENAKASILEQSAKECVVHQHL